MLTSNQSYLIEKYLPLMDIWAIEFVRRKKGKFIPPDDIEDYIQAAYMGLTEFVKKYDRIEEDNFGILILTVKRELFDHAYQSLGIGIPYNQFKRMYLEIEDMTISLEGLLEMTNNTFGVGGSIFDEGEWCMHSDISIDERIDLANAVNKMTECQKDVFHCLMKGMTIQEVADELGKSYTNIHEHVQKMRRILKREAWLSFLVRS